MNGATPYGAIVFTDIVGFTELTDRHGDDAALDLVERHTTLVREVLPPSGRIVKELGDGVLVWLDDALDAVCAAIELQARSGDGWSSSSDADAASLPLWVRIGIHWGAPRRRGDDIIGRDVNLASRIADLAGAGETLCTRHVVDAIDVANRGGAAGLAFDFVGAVFVKGIADAVGVHRIVAS